MKSDPHLFSDAIAAASQEELPYLGDPKQIEAILQMAASDFWDAMDNEDSALVPDIAEQIARRAADILLCKIPGVLPVPGWNNTSAIIEFVADRIGMQIGEKPEDVIVVAIFEMFGKFQRLCNFAATPGASDEQFSTRVGAIYEEYRNLFMGIPTKDF